MFSSQYSYCSCRKKYNINRAMIEKQLMQLNRFYKNRQGEISKGSYIRDRWRMEYSNT